MAEQDYQNREIDEKIKVLTDKMEENSHLTREKIQASHDAVELMIRTNDKDYRGSLTRIETQVGFTNGKVRKIIVALLLVSGIVIGQTFTNPRDIIQLLSGLL